MNATDDWYDVTQVTDRSYRITEAEKYGIYLVVGDERAIVVDAGIGVGDLYELVSALVETPITLVLTHTHWDHLGAANQFRDVRASEIELPADGTVRIDSISDEFVDRPGQFSERWLDAGNEFPDGVDPDEYAIEPVEASALSSGDSIDLGDRTLEVIPLPGHSPGHIGLLDEDAGVLYGGDVVHFNYGLYAMFEDSDLDEYLCTLTRVRTLRDEGMFDTLLTSHNDPLVGDELSHVDDLIEGIREILAGEREYDIVDTSFEPARSYRVGDSEIFTPVESNR